MAESLSGVGRTSLGVARARAWESRKPDRLFDDPYAAAFAATGERRTTAPGSQRARLTFHVIIRTRFYDDFLLAAGCRQVVLLAAGLDTRGRTGCRGRTACTCTGWTCPRCCPSRRACRPARTRSHGAR